MNVLMCTCHHVGVTYSLPDAELSELQQAELQTLLQRLVLQLQGSGVGGQVLHRGRGAVWTCIEHKCIGSDLSASASVSAIEINIIFPIWYLMCCLVVLSKISICDTISNTTGKTLRKSNFLIVWKDKYNKAVTWQWETTFLFLVSSRAQHQTVGNIK